MFHGDTEYNLFTGLTSSPPLNGFVFLYRPSYAPLRLSSEVWNLIFSALTSPTDSLSLFRVISSLGQLPPSCSSPESLVHWLQENAISSIVDAHNQPSTVHPSNTSYSPIAAASSTVKSKFFTLQHYPYDLRRFRIFSALLTHNSHSYPTRLLILLLSFTAFPAGWSFYAGSLNPLGRKLASINNIGLTLFSVAILFLFLSFACSVFTLALRRMHGIDQGVINLKFLAGFNPIVSSEELPPSSQVGLSRSNYAFLSCSGLFFYLILFAISILFLHLFSQSTLHILDIPSALFVVITICIVYCIWQVVPAPGSACYIILCEYGIFPSNSLGKSLRVLHRIYVAFSRKNFPHAVRLFRQYRRLSVFGIVIIFVLSVRIAFVIGWVLPSIASDLPLYTGSSSFILSYLLLLVSTLYYFYSTVVSPNKLLFSRLSSQDSKFVTSPILNISYSSSAPPTNAALSKGDHSDASLEKHRIFLRKPRNIFNPFQLSLRRRRILFFLLVLLLFPFRSSIPGKALVVEGKELSITNTDSYPAFIQSLYYSGPSKQILNKGDIIVQLKSPQLDTEIFSERQNILSLQSSISKTRTSISSYASGSSFQYLLDRDDELSQASARLEASTKSVDSLKHQLSILSSQVKSYESLMRSGSVSLVQYQEKLLAFRQAEEDYHNSLADLQTSKSELLLAKRAKRLDQGSKLVETRAQLDDDLSSQTADLAEAKSKLVDLQRRKTMLTIAMPFDGVIDSNTSDLSGKWIGSGEEILTVKEVPLSRVSVQIPEYDRSRLELGQSASVRLYARWSTPFNGVVQTISPSTIEQESLEYVEVYLSLRDRLPSSLVNATGFAKIQTGWTCLLRFIFEPIVRFVAVDAWSLLP